MPAFVCQACGKGFEVAPETIARYPGWQPKRCWSCRSGKGSSAARGGRHRSAERSKSSPRERGVSLAQVLETFSDGPKTGVFTDGAAHPNPGPGGWGAVYVVNDTVVTQSHGHEPQTTNNRMELKALLAGYELVPPGEKVAMMSDSNYCVRSINEWAAGWKRNNWRRKGGPIKNLDLVQELFAVAQSRPEIELRWIKAHNGYRWNEYADALACAYRRDKL